MSSESSDGGLFTSQESNANETPSCSHNTPINEFASLNLADNQQIPVWRPQADSDYDSDYGADTGKRKQRSQESETRDSKKKKLRANEEMECDEEVVKNSEEPMQKQEANEARAHKNESDEETKDEENSENENNEESDKEQEVMVQKPIPDLIDNLPSTSRLKRKWDEQAESVTAPKMFRPEDSEEEDHSEEEDD